MQTQALTGHTLKVLNEDKLTILPIGPSYSISKNGKSQVWYVLCVISMVYEEYLLWQCMQKPIFVSLGVSSQARECGLLHV